MASGAAPAGAVVERHTAEGIGTGQVGQNVRFTLTWSGIDDADDGAAGSGAGAGVPTTVVGKFAAADEQSRLAGLMTGTYVREVSFYRSSPTAAPCASRSVTSPSSTPTPASSCCCSRTSPRRQGDQIAGCTIDEAALAMTELGKLHASYWDDPSLDGREWLAHRARPDSAMILASMYDGFAGGFAERYGDRLPDLTLTVVEAFSGRIGDWLATDEGPLTLLHTDYRLDNMLFGTGPGAPPLTVVDWQTPAVGVGASDAAYFLGGGLGIDDRRTHERDLLEVYRQSLAAGGVELSADALWAQYRANAGAGLHMTVVASMLVGRHDRGDAMFCAMAERHTAHMDDLETLTIISG
ncbi:MAG: phosphotransferase [Acidimicrobiales bacterium]